MLNCAFSRPIPIDFGLCGVYEKRVCFAALHFSGLDSSSRKGLWKLALKGEKTRLYCRFSNVPRFPPAVISDVDDFVRMGLAYRFYHKNVQPGVSADVVEELYDLAQKQVM